MTEEEWLACKDPTFMVGLGYVTDRKRRLFAVACCRMVVRLMTDPRSRAAVDTAERVAERQARMSELEAARDSADAAFEAQLQLEPNPPYFTRPETYAAEAARRCAYRDATEAAEFASASAGIALFGEEDYHRGQADLLREIVGNPYRLDPELASWSNGSRLITIEPSWCSATVRGLGAAMYESNIFDRFPILADALEDAGCTNAEVLNHCRQPGLHVRGCWVLDLLLRKS